MTEGFDLTCEDVVESVVVAACREHTGVNSECKRCYGPPFDAAAQSDNEFGCEVLTISSTATIATEEDALVCSSTPSKYCTTRSDIRRTGFCKTLLCCN